MPRSLGVLLLIIVGCQPVPAPPPAPIPLQPQPVEWSADFQPAADGVNRFGFELYAKLREKPGNLFTSPFSISTALAMTADGANGQTLSEMQRVLHLPADRLAAARAWGGLSRYYAGGRTYELATANALWGQSGYPWRADFLDRQTAHYGAGLTPLDFRGDPDGSRRRINGWVGEQTRGKIPELLLPDDIRASTRMVLTNAIYFKDEWQYPFDKAATRDGPFRLAGGGTVTVPFMHQGGRWYRYAERDGVQVLELPYDGGELAMLILLPREPDGLPALEQRLTADAVSGWLPEHLGATVNVWLPKFKLDTRFSLPPELKALGMRTAFVDGEADFSAMAESDRLFVTDVIHQARAEVDEVGTVAVAATAVVLGERSESVPREPVEFRADRPFVFLIRDVRHGTVLFLGRVADPTR